MPDDKEIIHPRESSDIHRLEHDGRKIVLIGTAHVSKNSADLVRKVIAEERPDSVCVELDEKRFESLSKRKSWVNLNLKEIIYRKQLSTLLA
ncbi:MAG: TraB domain-containing protein, partial [Proteobacteria bacterium]|nr:TraB domain-containing protein [Pseudomonadota bacterium]